MSLIQSIILYAALAALPTYEIEDFYYRDTQGKMQPLPFQSKVFLPADDATATKQWLIDHNMALGSKEATIGSTKGFIVIFDNTRLAMNAMKTMREESIRHFPIVIFDTLECVPANSVIFKTKNAVNIETLKERLRTAYSLEYASIDKLKNNEYSITGITSSNPDNVLALANLLSEDTAWFTQAIPNFIPLHQPVESQIVIATPENCDLSHRRVAKLVIKVYHRDAKIDLDSLPTLGQTWNIIFLTTVSGGYAKSEEWCDFEPPVTKSFEDNGVKTIEISYPFTVYHNSECLIPITQIFYTLNDEPKVSTAQSVVFRVNSLIRGTGIKDLRLIDESKITFNNVQLPATKPNLMTSFNWMVAGGTCTILGGVLLFGGGLTLINNVWIKKYYLAQSTRRARKQQFEDLRLAADELGKPHTNSRELYLDIHKHLTHVFDIPVNTESINDPYIKSIVLELEKVYHPSPSISKVNRLQLQENIYGLINQCLSSQAT